MYPLNASHKLLSMWSYIVVVVSSSLLLSRLFLFRLWNKGAGAELLQKKIQDVCPMCMYGDHMSPRMHTYYADD